MNRNSTRWSVMEDRDLKMNCDKFEIEELQKLYAPFRSVESVRCRVAGIRRGTVYVDLDVSERYFVNCNLEKLSLKQIADKLDTPILVLRKQVMVLQKRQRARKHNRIWNTDDILYLKTYYKDLTPYELGLHLGRGEGVITYKLRLLKLIK